MSKLAQSGTFLTCNRNIYISNIKRDTDYLEVFRVLPQSDQEHSEIVRIIKPLSYTAEHYKGGYINIAIT
jgi:hypothetical protein